MVRLNRINCLFPLSAIFYFVLSFLVGLWCEGGETNGYKMKAIYRKPWDSLTTAAFGSKADFFRKQTKTFWRLFTKICKEKRKMGKKVAISYFFEIRVCLGQGHL